MARLLPLAIALFWASAASAQEHVQVNFDGWPDVACTEPGDTRCEGAYVETYGPMAADDAVPVSCGLGGCFELSWPADQALRRVHMPWRPGPGVLTAHGAVRMELGEDYEDPDGGRHVGANYQPLIRFFGVDPNNFGIDVAMIQRGSQRPRIAIVSAPDAITPGGVRYNDESIMTCRIDLPALTSYFDVEATIELDPTGEGNDRCVLTVDGVEDRQAGLDFRDGSASGFFFHRASFFGRVSNSADGPCNMAGWPPCGTTDATRTIIADDLCVSVNPRASEEGLCDVVPPIPADAGPPADGGLVDGGGVLVDSGTPVDSGATLPADSGGTRDGSGGTTNFRGAGGCTCDARGRPTAPSLPGLLFASAALLLGSRTRRERPGTEG